MKLSVTCCGSCKSRRSWGPRPEHVLQRAYEGEVAVRVAVLDTLRRARLIADHGEDAVAMTTVADV